MTTIDLHLPTSWNGCTTADLEAIAALEDGDYVGFDFVLEKVAGESPACEPSKNCGE